jgi:hypothetical protein
MLKIRGDMFKKVEESVIVMNIKRDNRAFNLKIVDLEPYSLGRTGLMEYVINKALMDNRLMSNILFIYL